MQWLAASVLLLAPGLLCAQGIDLKAMNTQVNPCDNFYQYACGNWLSEHKIPADEAAWGRFNELNVRLEEQLRGILQDAEKHQDKSEIDQKIGAFYESCMDVAEVDKRGAEPLKAELARIAAIAAVPDLVDEVARLHERQVDVFFAFGPSPDPKDARNMIADIDQGGLGLPERDYYLRTDPDSVELRNKYVAHVANMLQLAGEGEGDARHDAATVLAVETELAKASLPVTERRNPQLLVHLMSEQEFIASSPHFDFARFFRDSNVAPFPKINVDVPQFITAVNALAVEQRLADVKTYLRWQYIHRSATILSQRFLDENFDFYGRTLSGEQEIQPRWKRCVRSTDAELGDALGQKFVEEAFGKEGKERTLAMVRGIEKEMAADIDSLTWMSAQTKQAALEKLHAVANKIGYPDKWRDYSSVEITGHDYFDNYYRANEYEDRRDLNKIGKPVDRSEWVMSPPTVNAYYDPMQNSINFPAGILQPPFYSNSASDAVNYGAIGAVIGHELTHGFDDEGRQFDADGNLRDWWQKSDASRFDKLSSCFVNEYGNFTVLPALKLNGKLTLGENTADNGGIRLAYRALMDDLARKSIPEDQKYDGYTEAQQFFLGYAQSWCENVRPETLKRWTLTDPHSPSEYRVNGVVRNFDAFSQAFGCKQGDQLYAGQPCRIW